MVFKQRLASHLTIAAVALSVLKMVRHPVLIPGRALILLVMGVWLQWNLQQRQLFKREL